MKLFIVKLFGLKSALSNFLTSSVSTFPSFLTNSTTRFPVFSEIISADILSTLVKTTFFGVAPSFKRAHDLCASFLIKLLPLHNEKFHKKGVELNSRDGNPIYLDIFDENAGNFNVSISGSSGGGKSVFAQKLTDHSRAIGRSVVIIDGGLS